VEVYYLAQLVQWVGLTADYQFIADPGDNRARGPVSVVSLRLHLEAVLGTPTLTRDQTE
jgi:high affinity Mn2+ porin